MYPVLKEGVSIGTFQYKGSDTIHAFEEKHLKKFKAIGMCIELDILIILYTRIIFAAVK